MKAATLTQFPIAYALATTIIRTAFAADILIKEQPIARKKKYIVKLISTICSPNYKFKKKKTREQKKKPIMLMTLQVSSNKTRNQMKVLRNSVD